jgi:hypothetical protein
MFPTSRILRPQPPSGRWAVLLVALVFQPARAATAAPAITPTETILLFNGRDLSGFYTWLAEFGPADQDRVFAVVDRVDGAPALRMSGQHVGGLVTRERYANYRLVAEYRWGLITWKPRLDRARAGSISLHCQGEDGNYKPDFRGPYMRSIEVFLAEGAVGDFILLGGYERGRSERLFPTVTASVRPDTRIWDPRGATAEFTGGRVHWFGRDSEWQDVPGYRGRINFEKPNGDWNRLEIICAGGDIACILNGTKVNEIRNATYREGRIMFPSERAEIFFRRIELHPIQAGLAHP